VLGNAYAICSAAQHMANDGIVLHGTGFIHYTSNVMLYEQLHNMQERRRLAAHAGCRL
jgi:hypothetical protein